MRRHVGGRRRPADGAKLTLVAYSTPREVYAKLTKASPRPTPARASSFDESYGASGEQSRAVERGPARPTSSRSRSRPTSTRLVEAGLVARELGATTSTRAWSSNSVVVFAVRKGNPKRIQTWDDLIKDGVEVIDAEPVHLGRGEVERHGRLRRAAEARQDPRAGGRVPRRALRARRPSRTRARARRSRRFTGGKGDVLLAYENEAILAKEKGEDARLRGPGRRRS